MSDLVDGVLSAELKAAMQQHLSDCAACSQLEAEVRRGQAWLEMLKFQRPEPPATLAMKIISQTSGAVLPVGYAPIVAGATALPVPVVAPPSRGFLPSFGPSFLPSMEAIRNVLYQPRLAMTAAMAFFSLSLTLNITGVKLNDLHVADLEPSHWQHKIYEADAEAIRFYDNLPVVNEVETQVQQLRTNLTANPANDQTAPQPDQEQQQQNQPAPNGSSHIDVPKHHHNAAVVPQQAPPSPDPSDGQTLSRANENERTKA